MRGAAVIKKRGLSSAMSAAKAIGDHLRDWLLGTEPVSLTRDLSTTVVCRRISITHVLNYKGRCVSMAVPSDGSYNVPSGLVYSFPVVCNGGDWEVVKNIPITAAVDNRMQITKQELLMEQKTAFTMLGISTPPSSL